MGCLITKGPLSVGGFTAIITKGRCGVLGGTVGCLINGTKGPLSCGVLGGTVGCLIITPLRLTSQAMEGEEEARLRE